MEILTERDDVGIPTGIPHADFTSAAMDENKWFGIGIARFGVTRIVAIGHSSFGLPFIRTVEYHFEFGLYFFQHGLVFQCLVF